ncbi:hypothetical protein [Natronorubrum sp. DTA7]|uniref:hypothetical protein n=1 Tax=Natronorubrum sp. DTA7 TaxID=3447016 RepID=UPI003F82B5C5
MACQSVVAIEPQSEPIDVGIDNRPHSAANSCKNRLEEFRAIGDVFRPAEFLFRYVNHVLQIFEFSIEFVDGLDEFTRD